MPVKRRIAAVLSCLLLAGCMGESAPPESPAPSTEPAPRPVFALVSKEATNPYMQKMFEGFSMACEELGAEAVYKGPGSYSADDQIEIIGDLIAERADGIAIAANHADALDEPLRRAISAGIAVASLDSAVNPGSRMVHIQQADPEKIGRVLIQAANKMAGGSGKAVIISSTPEATNQKLWVEWMHREIDENAGKYKNFTLLPDQFGEDSLEKTKEITLRLLEDEPDLKLIITPSVVSMMAVGTVLAEKNSPILFTGLGLPSEMAAFIESGSCPWMYLWNPIDIGYLTAYSLKSLHDGGITGAEGDTFTAGRMGLRAVVGAVDGGTEILLGDPVKFDKDNIGEWKLVY